MEEVGRGRWKKFTAEGGRSSPRQVEEVERGTQVTPNQRAILEACSQNTHVTIAEIAGRIGISDRKTKANIAKLKAKGLIRRIGPDKGGHWEVLS